MNGVPNMFIAGSMPATHETNCHRPSQPGYEYGRCQDLGVDFGQSPGKSKTTVDELMLREESMPGILSNVGFLGISRHRPEKRCSDVAMPLPCFLDVG